MSMSSPQDYEKVHVDIVGIRQEMAPRKMLAITILVIMTQRFAKKLGKSIP